MFHPMYARKSVGIGWLGAAALALAIGAGGCNDIFSSKSCTADGRLYQPGDSVPGGTCSSCSCGDDGQVRCLALPCLLPICTIDGQSYPRGAALPPSGCNSCWCGDDGQRTCTTAACVADTSCAFDTTYTYGEDGGLVGYRDIVTLAPPASFSLQRLSYIVQPADAQCVPALPACRDSTKIDVADIVADLRHPDVTAALALSAPPFYGNDSRPVDGTAFKLQRADGHGFLVGDRCAADASCVTPPAGVQKLVEDLRALTAQQLMDPTCAAIPPAR